MGKTRRKLYGRSRRRQRGGGVCKWVLIGAVAALSGAHADDIGFRGRVSNWWYNPKPLDTGPSVELAKYIVDMKWMPSLNIYPETCTVPSGIDEAKVVEPYILEQNKRYTITGSNLERDLISSDPKKPMIVIFKESKFYEDYDDDENGNPRSDLFYIVQKESDLKDEANRERTYQVLASDVELTPVKDGGRKRRKTLRRK
jgi:hypothetical protein